MRALWVLVLSLVLTACGGNSVPPGIQTGQVAGTAFDSLVSNADVTIYDYSSGKKGAILAHTTSDINGVYTVALQAESHPILLELTGGHYLEEAGAGFQVALGSQHKLSAVENYKSGTAIQTSITTYTYLAAGLAEYLIKNGEPVEAAINDANSRVSVLVGLDILTITPKLITDAANASAALSKELQYGFLAGAISTWTHNHAPSASVAHLVPYTSIDFAQLLYNDVASDGLLDGVGLDKTGAPQQLSFGTTPLGVDVYRLGVGLGLIQMANDKNNRTGLTGSQLLGFARSYVASTDAMFNGIAPVTISATGTTTTPGSTTTTPTTSTATPVVSIAAPVVALLAPSANTIAGGTLNISASASSMVGLATIDFMVDGVVVPNLSPNPVALSAQINTTLYADGSHTVGVQATDLGGLVSVVSVPVVFNNVAPAVTITAPGNGSKAVGPLTITASLQSVVSVQSVSLLVDNVFIATAASNTAPSFSLNTTAFPDGVHAVTVKAVSAGAITTVATVQVTFTNFAPAVTLTTPAPSEWVRGAYNVNATIVSGVGLAKAELLIDGGVNSTPTSSLTAPVFNLDTTAFADGAHTIGVRATDLGGLVSTSTVSVTVNNVAPAVAITTPAANAKAIGIVNVAGTVQSTVGLNAVDLLVDGLFVSTAANLTAPSFSLNSALLADGSHTVSIRAINAGGLVTVVGVPLMFANAAPVVTVTAPANNAVVSGTVPVSGTSVYTPGLNKTELLVDGVFVATAANPAAPLFGLDTTPFVDGQHSVSIASTDIDGMVSTSTILVMVANTAPVVNIAAPANNVTVAGVVSVTGTAIYAPGIQRTELLVDSVLYATATNPTNFYFSFGSTAYADGTHTLSVRSTDVDGLSSTATIHVMVANTAPVVKITAPANNASVAGVITLSGTATYAPGVVKSIFYIDGTTPLGTAASPTAPSLSFNTVGYLDGAHSISLVSTDIDGLSTTATIQVMVANTAPVVSIGTPGPSSTISGVVAVTGTSTYASTIQKTELLVDSVLYATATNPTNFYFSLGSTAYADGTHTLSVRSTDVDGLSSTATIQVMIANTAPAVGITAPGVNAWVSGVTTLAGTATYAQGVVRSDFFMDGTLLGTAPSPTAPSLAFNSLGFADGAHTVSLTSTDIDGLSTTVARSFNVDNTAPTTTIVCSVCSSSGVTWTGVAADGGSGVVNITVLAGTTLLTTIIPSGTGAWSWSTSLAIGTTVTNFKVKDVAGNCRNYTSATVFTIGC